MILVWPSRTQTRLWLAPALLSLVMLLDSQFASLVYTADFLALAVALADLPSCLAAPRLAVTRRHARTASLGEPLAVELIVANHGSNPRTITLKDDAPESFDARPETFECTIPAGRTVALAYTAIPTRRGLFTLEQADMLIQSRFGFWRRTFRAAAASTVSIYPNIRQIARYTMLARRDRARVLGVRTLRQPGADNEFERLRDYVEGDDPRWLDWRATARRRKLTCRAYQQNQAQRVLFLVDCGRLSTGDSGAGLSPLDRSLNAMLLLAHVALLKGDQVGLLAFSNRIRAFVAPTSGSRAISRLVHAVHDVFPEFVESRLDRAFLELENRCRKRSLIVLLTTVIDESTAAAASAYLRNLKGRHLPLGVFLRDPSFHALADRPNRQGTRLYQAAAAAAILDERSRAVARLEREGVAVLDVFPDQLAPELVNRYLEIKAKHLL